MVYFTGMLKNKKRLIPLLLLSIYALLLGQEIIVNQVLCVKNNGAEAIELAVLDLQCQCKSKSHHPYPERFESQSQYRLAPQCRDCFDLLLDTSWWERNIPNMVVENNFLHRYDLNHPAYHPLNEPCRRLLESIPVSKFLCASLSFPGSTILRC